MKKKKDNMISKFSFYLFIMVLISVFNLPSGLQAIDEEPEDPDPTRQGSGWKGTIFAQFTGIGRTMDYYKAKIIIRNHTDADIFQEEKDSWATDMRVFFELDVPAPGTYDVIGIAPAYGEGQIVQTVNVTPGERETVDLDVSLLFPKYGTFVIDVLFQNRTPAKNVKVILQNVEKENEIIRYTNFQGRSTFEGQPGTYNISVNQEGYAEETRTLNITKRNTTSVNFTLTKIKSEEGNDTSNLVYYIFGGVLAILVVLFIVSFFIIFRYRKKKKSESMENEDNLICPNCGITVEGNMKNCPECSYTFPWMQFRCPECGNKLDLDVKRCNECGNTEFELR